MIKNSRSQRKAIEGCFPMNGRNTFRMSGSRESGVAVWRNEICVQAKTLLVLERHAHAVRQDPNKKIPSCHPFPPLSSNTPVPPALISNSTNSAGQTKIIIAKPGVLAKNLRPMSSSEPNEDSVLAQKCVAGEPDALAALRAKYQPVLLNVLVARGAAPADAEDVVSDIWLRCVPDTDNGQSLLEKYNGKCPLKSWLITVAFHRLIDMLRRKKPEVSIDDEGEDNAPIVLADTPRSEREEALTELLRESLQAAFNHCPTEDLLMLRLVHLHGLSQREVCRMWGWHEAKVSRRLSQAMKRIETDTLKCVRQRDPWLKLDWQDFVDMCETHQIGFL